MKIRFGRHDFVLHHSGVALWPEYRRLLVADLHLEKSSHFARRGYFLPPYDSHRTLTTLLDVCAAEDIQQIFILGDCFHDPGGYDRLGEEDKTLFDKIRSFNPVWIKGNHDRDFVPPGFLAFDTLECDGLIFRHEARSGAIHEISGHFHPKTDINHKGAILSRRCFVEDGKKMILPAFGAYTGGLNITDPAIRQHFPTQPRVYVPGEHKVYQIQKSDNC